MSDLAAGTRVLAADWPDAAYAADSTDFNNITNTTYVSGPPELGVTFVAPTSGRVLLGVGGQFRGPDRIVLTPQVWLGTSASGTLFLPANLNERAVMSPSSGASSAYSRFTLLEGLTPWATYYARVLHKCQAGAGTADLFDREITVVPTP